MLLCTYCGHTYIHMLLCTYCGHTYICYYIAAIHTYIHTYGGHTYIHTYIHIVSDTLLKPSQGASARYLLVCHVNGRVSLTKARKKMFHSTWHYSLVSFKKKLRTHFLYSDRMVIHENLPSIPTVVR